MEDGLPGAAQRIRAMLHAYASYPLVPAKAGTQFLAKARMPAFAGMSGTGGKQFCKRKPVLHPNLRCIGSVFLAISDRFSGRGEAPS
jgi:hypothetical protein